MCPMVCVPTCVGRRTKSRTAERAVLKLKSQLCAGIVLAVPPNLWSSGVMKKLGKSPLERKLVHSQIC